MSKVLCCLVVLLASCALSSCISLKSEYPEITYYNLKSSAVAPQVSEPVRGVLLVRQFLSNAEFRGDNLMILRDTNELDRYNYHRWIEEPSTLVSDMLVERCLSANLFSGGVVQGASQVLPDYFVEGRVLDMIAGKGRPEGLESSLERVRAWAKVRVHFTLVKIDGQRAQRDVVLQRVYEHTVGRADDDIASVAPAASRAASSVVDQFIRDMEERLR